MRLLDSLNICNVKLHTDQAVLSVSCFLLAAGNMKLDKTSFAQQEQLRSFAFLAISPFHSNPYMIRKHLYA